MYRSAFARQGDRHAIGERIFFLLFLCGCGCGCGCGCVGLKRRSIFISSVDMITLFVPNLLFKYSFLSAFQLVCYPFGFDLASVYCQFAVPLEGIFNAAPRLRSAMKVAANKSIIVGHVAVPGIEQINYDVVGATLFQSQGYHAGQSGIWIAFIPVNHGGAPPRAKGSGASCRSRRGGS